MCVIIIGPISLMQPNSLTELDTLIKRQMCQFSSVDWQNREKSIHTNTKRILIPSNSQLNFRNNVVRKRPIGSNCYCLLVHSDIRIGSASLFVPGQCKWPSKHSVWFWHYVIWSSSTTRTSQLQCIVTIMDVYLVTGVRTRQWHNIWSPYVHQRQTADRRCIQGRG